MTGKGASNTSTATVVLSWRIEKSLNSAIEGNFPKIPPTRSPQTVFLISTQADFIIKKKHRAKTHHDKRIQHARQFCEVNQQLTSTMKNNKVLKVHSQFHGGSLRTPHLIM